MDKIICVSALPEGCLDVAFADGRTGVFDVKPYMQSEFFGALRDQDYFAQVGLFFGGIGWPGGQDLSPDTISAELVIRGGP